MPKRRRAAILLLYCRYISCATLWYVLLFLHKNRRIIPLRTCRARATQQEPNAPRTGRRGCSAAPHARPQGASEGGVDRVGGAGYKATPPPPLAWTRRPLLLVNKDHWKRKANSAMNNPNARQPVVKKSTDRGGNDRLEYAVSSMQGYRENMEDAHATIVDLDASTATSFFGVYDGHGGPAVSKFCARHLHAEVLNHPDFVSNLPNAVRSAFIRMDEMMKTKQARKELTEYGAKNYCKVTLKDLFLSCVCGKEHPGPLDEGSTALVVLIRDNEITVGNAGDCRCVLSRNGQAIALSTDHKPSILDETQRIEEAGHSVSICRGASRIDEGIAVSRSIGDMKYKNNIDLTPDRQALTCCPEIRHENITDGTEFLIMACDGIWDVVLSQTLVKRVHDNMESGMDLAANCESILDMCIGPPRQSYDNMTVILIRFKHAALAPADPQHDCQEHAITDEVLDTRRKAPLEVESGTSGSARKSAHF